MVRPIARGGGPTQVQVRYALVELEKLRPHEQTQPGLLARVLADIRRDGCIRRPVLVESKHLVILDGHHRYEALKVLGCRRVPVYLVDYEDDGIGLTTWPRAIVKTVTKAEVIDRGIRSDPFPPKTTRHRVSIELEDVRVSLDELR